MENSIWNEIVGQKTAIELLTQAIARDQLAPAYLFVGPSGVGKQLTAELFATQILSQHNQEYRRISYLNSSNSSDFNVTRNIKQRVLQRNHPDLLWIEPTYIHQGKRIKISEANDMAIKRRSPPQIRLNQVREIPQFLSQPPLESERAVVVVEGAESMGEPASNALLKTLEEPGQASLILIAPSIESLLPTLISRCQRIPFLRLSSEELATILKKLGRHELLEEESILSIAQGSPGEAILSWERLQAIPSELIEGLTQPLRSLRQALEHARNIHKTLDTEEQLWLIEYLQHYYWTRDMKPEPIQHLEHARTHLLRYVQPRLVWETTLISILQTEFSFE